MILIRFSIQISFYFCLHQDIYFSVYYFSQVWHKGWHPYQSCHEKGHLNVCGWVGFLARRFIRDNLTLEIPNKSFVLYTFISKNRHKQDSKEIFPFYIFFLSCCKILQLFVLFNIPHFSIAQYLRNVCMQCSPSPVKNSDAYTKDAHK